MTLLSTSKEQNYYAKETHWSPYWSDFFITSVPWYIEKINHAPNLIICYGDSWTWGDSLGQANVPKNIDDTEYRTEHIYGSKLSRKLDADFINCAIPGIFNYWIHDRLQILVENDIQRLSKLYHNIWIVVTLTEVGRDFGFEKYVNDFEKFYNFKDQDPKTILVQCEKYDFTRLQHVSEQLPDNCKLIVGRNFTDTFEENKQILKYLVLDTWSRILFEKQNIDPGVKIPFISYGINRFDTFINNQKLHSLEYKQWMSHEILPNAKKVIDTLHKSIYNHKKATKHPNEQGHSLWADYLYGYINEQT